MPMRIIGIGKAVPDNCFTLGDRHQISDSFFIGSDKERRLLPVLYEKTRVRQRHSVVLNASSGRLLDRQSLYAATDGTHTGPSTAERMAVFEEHAGRLSLKAVQQLRQVTGFEPSTVSHLVTVSCSGFSSPGFDLELIRQTPLQASTQRTHVGFMGCHGGLNGLRVANAFANADPEARILMCATELCSLHYQYAGGADQIIANALFADGSIALYGMNAQAKCESGSEWTIADSASFVVPGSQEMMTWRILDHGFAMTLSPRLPELIQTHIRNWLEEWLNKHGLKPEDIRGWAVHPGGPKILSAFQAAMELNDEAVSESFDVLHEFGNMSSTTVFFIIDRFITQQNRLPCVSLGFGPGITIEAALFLPG